MNMMTRETRRDGFTLIELLVVISIIALLVGILLPALGAARRTAQGAVCLSNQRSFGQGMAIYAADHDSWLAGPNTSGFNVSPASPAKDRANAPAQNMDWISPTLGDSLGLPDDVLERMIAISDDDLNCPSNGEFLDIFFPPGTGPPGVSAESVRYTSYSSTLQFHIFGNPDLGEVKNAQGANIILPTGYSPRLDDLGSISSKVYAMDGARFIDVSGGGAKLSLNFIPLQRQGGNFMEHGPTMAHDHAPFKYTDSTGQPLDTGSTAGFAERYGYRHSGSFNTVFFDGHGERMSPTEAVAVDKWFPTGTLIKRASLTRDPDDVNDHVVR